MQIEPWENLRITTMTLVLSLTNGVNVEAAFHLLPITRIAIHQVRESSKCKLPHCEIPGSILSMRYRGNVRGVIRSKASPFKNAVTIDISTQRKNISLKLSSFSIQMCGASSREDGVEAATHVLNHLKQIQNMLTRIRADPVRAQQTIDWVKQQTRGDSIEKPNWGSYSMTNVVMRVYQPINDFAIVRPSIPIPEEMDPELVNFFLVLSEDFMYHSDFCQKIDYIPNIYTIIDEPLEIDHVNEAMVNYNYSLGFEVDRYSLNQYIDGQNGFISRYDNALATHVTIEKVYELPPGAAAKRRKNKVPHHTFLVYRSGSVTQSGPGSTLMRIVYAEFMSTIQSIYHQIQFNPERDYLERLQRQQQQQNLMTIHRYEMEIMDRAIAENRENDVHYQQIGGKILLVIDDLNLSHIAEPNIEQINDMLSVVEI